MIKERESDARQSLTTLRPKSSPRHVVDGELEEIRAALEMEERISSKVMWKDIWRGRDMVSLLHLNNGRKSDL